MKTRTAVEWLIEQICGEHTEAWKKDIEKAKEMEKEQIKLAYGQGVADELGEIIDATKDSEQYYSKTYENII